jgi:hypothetical protein
MEANMRYNNGDLSMREYKILTGNLCVTSDKRLRELELMGLVSDIEKVRVGGRSGHAPFTREVYLYNVTPLGCEIAESVAKSI